jgi:type I restriction enzyme, S subunit
MIGSTFKRVNVEEIRSLVVAMPPSNEQATIAAFIDRETQKLGRLHNAARGVIALLQERRSALITAAVTGQIDVRGTVLQSAPGEAVAA